MVHTTLLYAYAYACILLLSSKNYFERKEYLCNKQ